MSEANSALGPMTSGYDPTGNRTSLSYAGGGFVILYKYDLTGAMTEVDDAGGNPLVSYVYNDLGLRTTINRSNGVQTTLQYDYAQNPAYLQHSFSNPSNTVGETYHFTPAGQIFGHITSNDAYSWTSSAQPNLGYGTDGQNRYTSVGGAGYSYDAQANLRGDGVSTYGYDVYGRLTSVSGGASASISYDGLGRLWATTGSAATLFLYDGDRIAAEYDGGGNVLRRYVPGAGPLETALWVEGGSVRWYLQDRRGSVMAAVDGAQNLSAQNTYDESGVPGSSNVGRLQLNGLPWIPEAGLYKFGQRYYSPTLGRFLQPDPSGYADSLNLYRYAESDPMNVWDPTGLECGGFDSGGALVVCANRPASPAAVSGLTSGVSTQGGTPRVNLLPPTPPSEANARRKQLCQAAKTLDNLSLHSGRAGTALGLTAGIGALATSEFPPAALAVGSFFGTLSVVSKTISLGSGLASAGISASLGHPMPATTQALKTGVQAASGVSGIGGDLGGQAADEMMAKSGVEPC